MKQRRSLSGSLLESRISSCLDHLSGWYAQILQLEPGDRVGLAYDQDDATECLEVCRLAESGPGVEPGFSLEHRETFALPGGRTRVDRVLLARDVTLTGLHTLLGSEAAQFFGLLPGLEGD